MRVLPVDLSAVTPRRTETWLRLAHRVGGLFGIDHGETPGGQSWVMKYDALTVAEISRGGPLPSKEWHAAHHRTKATLGDSPLLPQGTWWIGGHGLIRGTGSGDGPGIPGILPVHEEIHEIAPATVSRFGPDRKAALVLAGSNELFASLLPVFREVVGTVVGDPAELHPRLRLALWAVLVHEAYRSQPALFVAAVQARAIQRALSLAWTPVAGLARPMARGEHGSTDLSPVSGDPSLSPTALNVLDMTLAEYMDVELAQGAGEQANLAYLRDDVVARWTKHLLESPDRGVVWETEAAPGRHRCEVLLPMPGPVVSLVTEAFRGPDQVDVRDRESWSRFCPRVPSRLHAAGLSERGQVALIWSLVQLYRVLRQDPVFEDKHFRRHVTEQFGQVAQLSAELLGPVHPITYFARNRHADSRRTDLLAERPDEALRAGAEVSETLVALGELRATGLVSGGFYAEALVISAPAVRMSMVEARTQGDQPLAESLERDLQWLWEEFFATLQVDPAVDLESADPEKLTPLQSAIATYLHNYAVFRAETGGTEGARTALRLLDSIVVPSRTGLARVRGTEQPLRLSLQVLVDRIDSYLASEGLSAGDARHWSDQAWKHTQRLMTMPFIQQVLTSRGDLIETKINALTRIVTGWIIALETKQPGSIVHLDRARAQVDRLATLRHVDVRAGLAAEHSFEQERVFRLHQRLSAVEHRLDARTILIRSAMAASAVAVVPGQPDAATDWVVALSDADLVTALRGPSVRRDDPSLTLRLTWTEDEGGTLNVLIKQPIVSADVAAVTVRLTSGEDAYEAPLSLEVRPGHPVTMEGVLTRVPRPVLEEVLVEMIVRGRLD